MNPSTSFIQAGAVLLATALRDPAPIVSGDTTWNFIQITDALFSHLTKEAQTSQSYQRLLDTKRAILEAIDDFTPEEGENRFGERLTEAFAAYIEQAGKVIPLLEEHADDSHVTELFESVMAGLKKEIAETEGVCRPVYDALAAFEACEQSERDDSATLSHIERGQ